MDPQRVRNFSIIAHIDHGKSTLADRFLELTGALQAREMEAQVLDTMDRQSAEPEEARRQIEEIIGIDGSTAILTSAKEGIGIADVLEAVIHRLPPPAGDESAPLKALIFDSWYDAYRGVVIVARVI